MPIYEYECTVCGARFELRRNVGQSDSEVKCPKCGADNTRRLLSLFAAPASGETCASSGST
ncbi:MAG: zinc ribbon domain-containing protein [Chloroflexi bacterium]|nr:MAG: zinc ribbon domain-containing protein [Chloroflexota bacterium]RLC94329.1 MAG: zinc ribbon domain-containing protein [Chloroflexota bacterium]